MPHIRLRRSAPALVALLGVALVGVLPAGAEVGRAAAGGASETGVTSSTVNVAVVADVDNAIAPNVFKGVVDGAQAAA